MADTHPAAIYLKTLFDESDVVCLCFIHATKMYAAGNSLTENRFVRMADVISDKGIKRLMARNKEWNCFVSMQPFLRDSKQRTKANIAEVLHCFLDCDENGDAVLADVRAAVAAGEVPAPSIVVCSSPSRFQIIWNIEGCNVAQVEALNKNLVARFKADPAATDAARVLRIPSTRNLKPKYVDKPVATIVERNVSFLLPDVDDFHIPCPVTPDLTEHVKADDLAVQQSIEFLQAAMDTAKVGHGPVKPWNGSGGAFMFDLTECPWNSEHTNGRISDAIVVVQPSSKYAFKCLHAHCASRNFADFRAHLEKLAGKRLKFGTKKPAPTKTKPQGRAA